jgi:molybdate transport system ATP-binding protein
MNASIIAKFKLSYGEFKLDVDLSLPSAGITVLFGHSGSGKTTLLRCIAGLQKAPEGYLQINGEVWQDSDKHLFIPTHQRALGYVFQEANLFAHLSVNENLNYGLKRLKNSIDATQKTHIIELLGISHLLARMPENLSGGERQRVAIARALVLNPSILLMDEPLASLDWERKQEVLPFLMRLNQQLKIPVLYVTHSKQEMAQLADYLVLMSRGKVDATGPISQTLNRVDLSLAQDRQASCVWEVRVAQHDSADFLTQVQFSGGCLFLPMIPVAIGETLRVQIFARDVSITLDISTQTSILNILPATILAISKDDMGQSVVSLQVGENQLLAHITQKSAAFLNLSLGKSVFVQIKGTSILN